ncbi:TonB-dependent receptor [Gemmatimonas sp.]
MNRPLNALFLVGAPLLLTATAPRRVVAQAPLRGRLYDSYTQLPVAGVSVSGNDASADAAPVLSDRDGGFTVPCVLNRVITFRRVGYETVQSRVTDCGTVLQVALTPSAQALGQVTVVDARESTGGAAVSQPQSVSTLTRADLRRGTGLFLDDALNVVPGVRFDRRTMSGGQRITIRGYGNRSNFDGSGYKAYLNGIPLTDAEGITVLDDVDFGSLGRVDIVRGPASSLFGSGIGGVVNFWSLRPERPGTTIEQETMAGSDGLRRSDTRFASSSPTSTILVNYGRQRYDSYRVHSASTKDFASFVGDFRPSAQRTITTFLSYARSRDERAGQLDSAQFFGKRNAGEQPYLANDAHVDMETLRAGVTHSYRANAHLEPVVTAYVTGTTREDIFAAGLNPKSTQTFGTRAVLNTRFAPGGHLLMGATGIEFEQSNIIAKGYRYTNAVLGALTNDLETRAMQTSVFSQWDVQLPAAFVLTGGASVNLVEYTLRDRLANSANPTRKSISGTKRYDPELVPRVGLRRTLGQALTAYGTVSGGFTPATSSDAVIQFTGQANDDLAPERGTLYEVGVKGSLPWSRAAFQLALYDLRVTDKLTSQSVFDANGTQLYAYTVNAGNQSNKGVELALQVNALPRAATPTSWLTTLRPFLTYTGANYRYTRFLSDNNNNARTIDYTGKDVVGVPKQSLALGLDVGVRGGGYATVSYENRSSMPITFDNTRSAPGYDLLNARVGVARNVGRRFTLDAYVGGTNLTNSLYYTMVFLNANYTGAPPAIYLPGAYSARYFGGIKLGLRE